MSFLVRTVPIVSALLLRQAHQLHLIVNLLFQCPGQVPLQSILCVLMVNLSVNHPSIFPSAILNQILETASHYQLSLSIRPTFVHHAHILAAIVPHPPCETVWHPILKIALIHISC